MPSRHNNNAAGPGAGARRARGWRLPALIALLASALTMTACGGGGEVRTSGDFTLGIVIGGQSRGSAPVAAGGSVSIALRAGQSLQLDAGEPVVWTLFVGGSAVNANGVQVRYAGVDIAATVLSSTAIAVDTYAAYLLTQSVPFILVATSTYDSADIVTAYVSITN